MSIHYSNAQWEGNLAKGKGKYTLNTSGFEGALRFSSRFEDDKKASSPEELIGAALASCYSMALAHALDQAGYIPEMIITAAEVTLSRTANGFSVTEILLKTKAKVRGVENERFLETAEKTKGNCPVSRALSGTNIKLVAELVNI